MENQSVERDRTPPVAGKKHMPLACHKIPSRKIQFMVFFNIRHIYAH
jgi:hypothetical protein